MTRAITCCLLTLGLLGGCAHVPPAADVAIPSIGQPIGQTGFFTLVQASEAITLREMTRRLLGEEDLAELVARANALPVDTIVASGQIIALPRKPIHSSGISPHGIQTVQILCYHRFSLRASSEPMTVSAADFEAQMAYLVNNGYRVIRLAELAGFMEGGTLFPERLVVITIDDGFASVAEVAAPILAKYGLPATLFVYPEFIGGGLALSWDALKALADSGLFDVQSHSTSHTSHARRPQESDEAYRQRLDREIDTASRSLAGHLGRAPSVYAYPYGDTSTDTIHALQARQYRFGVTVRRGGTAAFSHPFTLRRTMIYGHDSLAQFARKLVTRQPLPRG
ncbi:MAG: polysaccharide deacetylase family protein [Pseudomonadales bacterium]|nr:polysaccharide deacetylase family protein [Pseudomonadales bacterium]MCP5183272.1 polysaccharide deacetylase family protein [Pseudomonadales bacterium]